MISCINCDQLLATLNANTLFLDDSLSSFDFKHDIFLVFFNREISLAGVKLVQHNKGAINVTHDKSNEYKFYLPYQRHMGTN